MSTNMINTILFCLYLTINNNYIVESRINDISIHHEDLELERQLKIINKPPLKSIQKDGYTIDCIDIYNQPAFDHPLLKNHTIQLKPSFEVTNTKSDILSSIKMEEDLCVKGTIPIRRITKDDLIRTKHLSNVNASILNKDIPGRQYAGVKLGGTSEEEFRYFEIKGDTNVYNLPVQDPDQITGAYIYLSNDGSEDYRNIIMAGWELHPILFGDGQTYFFIRWEDKSQNKGCTNLYCPGFVQTESRYALGTPLTNTSTYRLKIFEMGLNIVKDPETNNWWVNLNNVPLGYYPEILFSKLHYGKEGGWTGMTSTPKGIPSPPMGSGYFPDNDLYRTGYFRKMTFSVDNRKSIGPVKYKYAGPSVDNPNCYGVQYEGYNDDFQEYSMLYGGPGGNCGE